MNNFNERSEAYQSDLLKGVRPDELPFFLQRYADMLLSDPRPFAEYMRAKFKEKECCNRMFSSPQISPKTTATS